MTPDANSLIELARSEDNPSADDKRRVRHALVGALGAGAFGLLGIGAAATGSSLAKGSAAAQVAGSAAATGTGLGAGSALAGSTSAVAGVGWAKLVAWGGAAFLASATTLGVGLVAVESSSSKGAALPVSAREVSSASAAVGGADPASGRDSEAVGQGVVAQRQLQAPTQPAEVKRPRPRTTTAPPKGLERELPLIEQAQQALRQNQPRDALKLLAEHERLFPHGVLLEERLAATALALCQLEQPAQARSLIDTLQRSSPHSPHLPRVNQTCGFEE